MLLQGEGVRRCGAGACDGWGGCGRKAARGWAAREGGRVDCSAGWWRQGIMAARGRGGGFVGGGIAVCWAAVRQKDTLLLRDGFWVPWLTLFAETVV